MYANLRVVPLSGATVKPDAIGKRTLRERGYEDNGVIHAYEVTVNPDGTVSVGLDGNDDGGSYYEEAGRVRIDGPVTITADF